MEQHRGLIVSLASVHRRVASTNHPSLDSKCDVVSSRQRTMSLIRAYEEVVDFIAAGAGPENVVAFRPSEATRQRVAELVAREKTSRLTPDEISELDHY